MHGCIIIDLAVLVYSIVGMFVLFCDTGVLILTHSGASELLFVVPHDTI